MKHELIESLIPVVRAACRLIETIRADGVGSRLKADHSPVTIADEQAESLIVAALGDIDRGALVVGEETCAANGKPPVETRFWLIDALDGTRSFLDGGTDYSVNVALVENGVPVLGIVGAPAGGTIWAGASGSGALRIPADGVAESIACRRIPPDPVVVTSRSHSDAATLAYIARIDGAKVRPSGSSLKFCMLAEGKADVYPRFGQTSEWDTAAAHAVLLAAGGAMFDAAGEAFRYGKADYLNGPFLAVGDAAAYAGLPSLGDALADARSAAAASAARS